MLTTPTVPRFQATISVAPRRWRVADSITNERPVALTGSASTALQPRVTHVGIDDRELGALSDRIGDDLPMLVGKANPMLSRVTARPRRFALFSSCGCES
jgi:hypothetical protein